MLLWSSVVRAAPSLGDDEDREEREDDDRGRGARARASIPAPRNPIPDVALSADASSHMIPFGAKLFQGNFLKVREDGVNPNYVVMPGDQVAVFTWGTVEVNDVFLVDGQGNLFLPGVGPVRLAGVKNAELTKTVRDHIRTVFRGDFGVYTNLMTAKPVAVFVTGAVPKPGRYAGIPSDSVLYFLDQAGGIDPDVGSYRHVQLLRDKEVLADVDLYDFIIDGHIELPQLQDNDTIVVLKRGPVVALRGQVATPALIELPSEGALGKDALQVVPKEAAATEVTVSGIRGTEPFALTMRLEAFETFELRDGDAVELRSDYRPETILIGISGEFEGPSLLSVRKGSRLVDVLNYVPVDPELADLDSIYIERASVAKAQKDTINDSLFRLERAALLALSSTQGVAQIRAQEAQLTKQFVDRARLIEPVGRVVTSREGKQLNVLLEDRDRIVIPTRSNIVRVGGEVLMSQALFHKIGAQAGDYIEAAGGFSDRADRGKVILMHADASVEMTNRRAEVRPGDEVLVPPRVDRKIMQGVLDVSTIIYQLATATGVLLPFFTPLLNRNGG